MDQNKCSAFCEIPIHSPSGPHNPSHLTVFDPTRPDPSPTFAPRPKLQAQHLGFTRHLFCRSNKRGSVRRTQNPAAPLWVSNIVLEFLSVGRLISRGNGVGIDIGTRKSDAEEAYVFSGHSFVETSSTGLLQGQELQAYWFSYAQRSGLVSSCTDSNLILGFMIMYFHRIKENVG